VCYRTARGLVAGIVDFRRGRVTILDAEKLKTIGQFDPVYLYGEGNLAVQSELDGPVER